MTIVTQVQHFLLPWLFMATRLHSPWYSTLCSHLSQVTIYLKQNGAQIITPFSGILLMPTTTFARQGVGFFLSPKWNYYLPLESNPHCKTKHTMTKGKKGVIYCVPFWLRSLWAFWKMCALVLHSIFVGKKHLL